MSIQILSLSDAAIKRLDAIFTTFGIHWKVCAISCDSDGCKDVIISPAAIVSIDGDNVAIEIVNTVALIAQYEFFKIEIV